MPRRRSLLAIALRVAAFAAVISGGLSACNTAGFDAVSISPIYGWTDGCNTVRVSGHGFAEDATVTLGTLELPISARGEGIDAGYWIEGTLPAAAAAQAGYATVSVNSAGATSTIADAYYYVACPAEGTLDSLDTETVAAFQNVTMQGCGLSATLLVQLTPRGGTAEDAVRVPITSTCGTASTSFVAPDLPDNLYDVQIVNPAGDVLFPPYLCPADPTDTAAALLWCPTLTYGAAQ